MENREPTTEVNEQPSDDFGANAIRLNLGEWIIVAILVSVAVLLGPWIWKRYEAYEPDATYRMPFAMSEDYWHFERLAEHAKESERVFVVGDSVVWGEYVLPGQSIAGQLNRRTESERFANLGVAGIHPVALLGLLAHHGEAIRDAQVILHLNLLWMSSPKRDLQSNEEFRFNHPRLVPQLFADLPSYRANASERIGIALERRIDAWNWVRHVRIAYFDSQDLHHWTVENPKSDPWSQITFELPAPRTELRHSSVDWTERGIRVQDFDWVELDSSTQWAAFRRCVDVLRARGNTLRVVVGPLNEHLMTDASKAGHTKLVEAAKAWLESEGLPSVVPDVLPSNEYADASHPLAPGYARLVEALGWEE